MGRRSKSRGKSGRRSASTNSYKNVSAASRAKSAVNKSLGRSKSGPTNSQVTTGGSTSVQRADPKNILDEFLQGVNRKDEGIINQYVQNPLFQGRYFSQEQILNSEGITLNRLMSKVLNLQRVNINKAPSQVDFTNYGKMYVFFTKPDLHLFENSGMGINQSIIDNNPDLYMRIMRNPAVARSLQILPGNAAHQSHSGGMVHLLGNLCSEVNSPEISMSVTQAPKNQKGFGISYLGDFWESLQEGDIEISFIDTKDRDVSTMLEIWALYAEGVRNGNIFKKYDYIANNIIDYGCTIYIVAVDESMNILSHTALVGCFPRSFNMELLNYRATMLTAQNFIGPFSYTWHVSFVAKPNAHSTTRAFNYVSGYGAAIEQHVDVNTTEVAQAYMHKKVAGYWHHNGLTMDMETLTDYPYHFSLFDKFAEIPGISHNVLSSGVVQYTLAFASKDLGKTNRPEDFWRGPFTKERNRWKDAEIGIPGLVIATGFGDANSAGYGNLLNVGRYGPMTQNGVRGVYQGGWRNWNSGANRFGKNFGVNAANNANVFRNALRSLTGINRR